MSVKAFRLGYHLVASMDITWLQVWISLGCESMDITRAQVSGYHLIASIQISVYDYLDITFYDYLVLGSGEPTWKRVM